MTEKLKAGADISTGAEFKITDKFSAWMGSQQYP